MGDGSNHRIYFEVDGVGYAIKADQLCGVGTACPTLSYPGLPQGVPAIVHWEGKVFPVLDAFLGPNGELSKATYLFSAALTEYPFSQLALAVFGRLRVLAPERVVPLPKSQSRRLPEPISRYFNLVAKLSDQDGLEALEVGIRSEHE